MGLRPMGMGVSVRRRPGAVAMAVVVMCAATACGTAAQQRAPVASGPVASGPGDAGGRGWRPVAASPLAARESAPSVVVGNEVLVVGGHEQPCPPAASCVVPPYLSDGAAYDAVRDRWRRIASPPSPVAAWSTAVVGDEVWAVASSGSESEHLLHYSVREDRWTRPPAPTDLSGAHLVAVGEHVVAYGWSPDGSASPDMLRDPRDGTWRPLPPAPLGRLAERVMVQVGPDKLVVVGVPAEDADGRDRAPLYRAALLDLTTRRWRSLPPSEVLFSESTWLVVGEGTATRVVNPTDGAGDGDGRWGRTYAAAGMLDPARGTWSPLPARPQDHVHRRPTPAVAGAGLVVDDGQVLDVAAGTWRSLAAPPDADAQGATLAWVGDRLFVWGGSRFDPAGTTGRVLSTGWTWRP